MTSAYLSPVVPQIGDILSIIRAKLYSMFHVTWTTFKFNKDELGTVSAYVMSSVPWSKQSAR